MNRIRIDETTLFHNKKVNHFEEWFNEETRKIEFLQYLMMDKNLKLNLILIKIVNLNHKEKI